MLKRILFVLVFLCGIFSHAHESDSLSVHEDSPILKVDYVESAFLNDSLNLFYVSNTQLFQQQWNELAHPLFWKSIMTLPSDSCVINIGGTRQIVEYMSVKDWNSKTDKQKDEYRDSIRENLCLTASDKIFMTTGKKDFYVFDGILPTISRGVEVFKSRDVDPWYAQAILMIESPGRLAKSTAGAYGSFQLMAGVARKFGLTVNNYVDERKDFDKSAVGASRLISEVCIPEAKNILNAKGITYNETDLWFRLFVMHVYHAGAYNVAGVVNKINPSTGGMDLIQQMWGTENGKFRNASQNYTQLALAAMMIFEEMVWDCYG